MTVALAAGGTGGHVIPALAVAEAIDDRARVVFLGGDRFEASAVPAAGIELIQADVRGLQRSLTLKNLGIPRSVWRASKLFERAMRERGVRVLLAMGGYVAVPAGLAARRMGIPLFLHEQNAHAGLANRVMGRWAEATFTSFPETEGARGAREVGNPVKKAIANLDRESLRPAALARYGLEAGRPTVGIVGGSLGSRAINEAMLKGASTLAGEGVQVIHLTGDRFKDDVERSSGGLPLPWRVVGFEAEMQWFFAAVDLVVSRASGMVAELTATGTPSVLVPGDFGSKGHQLASAEFIVGAGAGLMVKEEDIAGLPQRVAEVLSNGERLAEMAAAAVRIGHPDAAETIAREVLHAAG